MDDYTEQAEQFLTDTGTTFEIIYSHTGPCDVYTFTLRNARGEYSARFGDSLYNTKRREWAVSNKIHDVAHNPDARAHGIKTLNDLLAARSAKPTAYDVLACLQKSDVGTFADFCADFGYDDDSIRAQKVYFDVQKEYAALRRMYTPAELDQLGKIS